MSANRFVTAKPTDAPDAGQAPGPGSPAASGRTTARSAGQERLAETGTAPGTLLPRWQVLTATARGAAHQAAGRPLQDAVACYGDPSRPTDVLAVSVADGHGHPRHGRSAIGAELAVEVAGAVGREQGHLLAGEGTPEGVCAVARTALIPAIAEGWRGAVADHASAHPLDPGEERWLRPGEAAAVAYGTTLLLAVVAFPWLALCQIGDGDIVVMDPGGSADRPVPPDARLDGRRTTSLCQTDAEGSFRCAALALTGARIAAVLLATDGFGNSHGAGSWPQAVGLDVVTLTRDRGVAWMREHLPEWAARCASAGGSGDDTAVALLLSDELLAALVLSSPGEH